MLYYVNRNKTVMVDGVAVRPGEQIALPADEAARLLALGYLSLTPPNLEPIPVANPNGLIRQGYGVLGGAR